MRAIISGKQSTNVRKIAFLTVCGAFAGFVNGFLGTGGGIILLLSSGIENKLCPPIPAEKDRFAGTCAITLLLSVVSAFIYFGRGGLDLSSSVRYILPALLGGVLGALLLDRIKVKALGVIFSLLLIVSGAIMLLR